MTDKLPIPADVIVEQVPIPADLLDAILDPAAGQAVVVAAASHGVAWRPQSDGEAEWAMRKYLEARDEVEIVEAAGDDYIMRIRNWVTERSARARRAMEFFGGHLGRYAIERREATGGRVKTLQLPSGRVPTRGNALRLEVDDAAKLERWLLTHPEWKGSVYTVEMVREFNWSRAELLRLMARWPRNDAGQSIDSSTGEVVDGVRVVAKDAEIHVQTIEGNE